MILPPKHYRDTHSNCVNLADARSSPWQHGDELAVAACQDMFLGSANLLRTRLAPALIIKCSVLHDALPMRDMFWLLT
eukprot:37074-Amphidinium_carterae.1